MDGDGEVVGFELRTRRPDDVEVSFYVSAILQYHHAVDEYEAQREEDRVREHGDLFTDPGADSEPDVADSAGADLHREVTVSREEITVVRSVAFRHSKIILLGDSVGVVTAVSYSGRIRARIPRPDALLAAAAADGVPGLPADGDEDGSEIESNKHGLAANTAVGVTAMARTSAAVAVAHGPTIRVLSVSRRQYNNPTCDIPGDGHVMSMAWDVLVPHIVYAATAQGQVFAFNTRHRDGRATARVGPRCVLKHSISLDHG